MEVILALAILFAIWVIVLWGSSYIDKNVKRWCADPSNARTQTCRAYRASLIISLVAGRTHDDNSMPASGVLAQGGAPAYVAGTERDQMHLHCVFLS
jgi:hypothetical protein